MVNNISKIISKDKLFLDISKIENSLDEHKIPNNDTNIIEFLDIVINTKNINNYINAVELHTKYLEFTLRDSKIVDLFDRKDIDIIATFDEGSAPLAGSDEVLTKGIDSLENKIEIAKKHKISIAKWSIDLSISNLRPSRTAAYHNAVFAARFIAACLKAKIVPLVDFKLSKSYEITPQRTQDVLNMALTFIKEELEDKKLTLDDVIIKIPFINDFELKNIKKDQEKNVKLNQDFLRYGIIMNAGGVVFEPLADDLTSVSYYKSLSMAKSPMPISFSFEGDLLNPIFLKWKGKGANVEKASKDLEESLLKFT